jgi:photosystem II Psb27 protein
MGFFRHFALTVVFVAVCYVGVWHSQPAHAGLFGNRSQKVMTTKEIREQVNAGLTGDYESDTKAVIASLRYAVNLPPDAPDREQAESDAHFKINAYAARYRINSEKASLYSYTTMRTLLNNLAAYYNGSTRKPVPQKTKERVLEEMERVELALSEGR